jgi:hypothetical protein
MSKSYVLFSLALGGLALAGCSKEPEPTPVPVPPATTQSTTVPTTDIVIPTTTLTVPVVPVPATGPVGDLIDKGEKKATDIVGGLQATTLPDATK